MKTADYSFKNEGSTDDDIAMVALGIKPKMYHLHFYFGIKDGKPFFSDKGWGNITTSQELNKKQPTPQQCDKQ